MDRDSIMYDPNAPLLMVPKAPQLRVNITEVIKPPALKTGIFADLEKGQYE